ncbi:MAG TPA: class I SAM-dependent methyltransferase [Thermoanaerobaculia bacterium]|nr:class I SAM-dependent methyltransferase [Thermoanaerobaculia bacterium]HUM29178.1 class I SAM-dependent methyltransferase [Thermoanaerobaculia bacterium]HXK67556.1 class I SAM-dependent methyltransferase [Thermoanaerobaculia bacterium]
MTHDPKSARSGKFWDAWRRARQEEPANRWSDWWTCPILIQRFFQKILKEPCSSEEIFFKALAKRVSWPAHPRTLSLCGGIGDLELRLIRYGLLGETTILEISEEAVREGRKRTSDSPVPVKFVQKDANTGEFGRGEYDLVLSNSALHHLDKLEQVSAGIVDAMKPNGVFIFQEYTGPDRFQWEEPWTRAARRILGVLSRNRPELSIPRSPWIPSIEEIETQDPTEAIHSSQILPTLKSFFTFQLLAPMGGALYQMLFPLILPLLNPEDPGDHALVERICAIEDSLMNSYGYSSHFTFGVARPAPADSCVQMKVHERPDPGVVG